MASGDELILLDGTYSEITGTGYISYLGNGSGQPPSGKDLNNMTYIHALNPGNVLIRGSLFIGRSARKDSFIKYKASHLKTAVIFTTPVTLPSKTVRSTDPSV